MPDPFNQMRRAIFFLMILSILILTVFNSSRAHDNSSSTTLLEYYYPSAAVYGFVQECWTTMEGFGSEMTQTLWPTELQTVCGCILDQMRMTITWREFRDEWKEELTPIQKSIASMHSDFCMKQALEMKGREGRIGS